MDHATHLASGTCPWRGSNGPLFKSPSQALKGGITTHGRLAAVKHRASRRYEANCLIVIDGEMIGAIGASFDTQEHDL